MAQATLSMRVDDTLKKNFDSICDDFRFPKSANKITPLEMRAAAAEAGIQDMPLEEINAEIQEVRNGR